MKTFVITEEEYHLRIEQKKHALLLHVYNHMILEKLILFLEKEGFGISNIYRDSQNQWALEITAAPEDFDEVYNCLNETVAKFNRENKQ